MREETVGRHGMAKLDGSQWNVINDVLQILQDGWCCKWLLFERTLLCFMSGLTYHNFHASLLLQHAVVHRKIHPENPHYLPCIKI